MIMATVQSEKGAENITAKDGRLLTGDEAQEVVNEIMEVIKDISVRDRSEGICELDDGRLFCTLYRNIQDASGRVSIALIIWDKNISDSIAQGTLMYLQLSFYHWREMFHNYQNAQRQTYRRKVIVCAGLLAIVVVTIGCFWFLRNIGKSNTK